ncbi:Rad1-domain-containing protein [Pseudovirgaria hyperparasitica]|uniref:Rad1-domain-containing protein n=1 Tax=Pseudovirgaria hyperparasitica TaxID=470096 RepID=A0A6A6W774_9PEZI|nr:Rad1-domain-containing protein [Pseudovirgaria hyperparasitica]KAF2758738.1 Rad1-domain-containing protein [Pseudovirgaria hyperparasitica]
MENDTDNQPTFSAVSSTARTLYQLLRCISFASKAQVRLSEAGMRFGVEDSSVMEGHAFLGKDLFTTYQYNAPPPSQHSNTLKSDDNDQLDEPTSPIFEISLPSLLETLQIFGLADLTSTRTNPWSRAPDINQAFDNRVLGLTGICKLRYARPGAPLSIVLEESGITTTCDLVTYEPTVTEDIPFARDALMLKIVMRASWLYDALLELSATNPETLTLTASPVAPYFALSAAGPLGSATVEFSSREQGLLETFMVSPAISGKRGKVVNSYKFSLIKAAQRAMAAATKVSIRGDHQGVLNLQFMIEVDTEKEKISFIDFVFVPLAEDGDEEGTEDEEEDDVGDGRNNADGGVVNTDDDEE